MFSTTTALARHLGLVALLATATGTACGGLPEAPCDRLSHCEIDRSCGKSIGGGYEVCGKEASCEAIVSCVGKRFADLIESADGQAAYTRSGVCQALSDYAGPLPRDPDMLRGCQLAFDKAEKLASADPNLQMLACRTMKGVTRLDPGLKSRYEKVCQ